jgi:hypothetical protein
VTTGNFVRAVLFAAALSVIFAPWTHLNLAGISYASMPIDLDAARGVSRSTREIYYDKLRELARRYHFPLVESEDHDADPTFLIAHREHPTPKGWMYYDKALDNFFHKTK